MVRVLVLLSIAGCGRVGFDPAAFRDANTSSDNTVDDAGADAVTLGPCTRLAIMDDFNDGVRAAFWSPVASKPASGAETSGELVITLGTSGGIHYAGYDTTAGNYDLRDRCIYVTYSTTPTAEPGVEMQFTVLTPVGTVGFVYHNGLLDAFSNISAFNSVRSVPYDAANHKVLRLRDDAGTMSWETSADGTTFGVFASAPEPFDVSSVAVTLEAGTYTNAPSPGVARYDNFDVP